MNATFDESTFKYTIDRKEVDALTAKGASAAIARQSKANLQILGQRFQNEFLLQQNKDALLNDWYAAMQRETKLLHMGEFALANGGIDQVNNWGRAEQIIADTWNGNDDFKGLRAFAEDIQKGRYGTTEIGRGFLARSLQYADAGRATYENERLAAQMLKWQMEAKRVMGGVEHCEDCPAWAALGWIEATVMYAKYYIGAAQCRINDYCSIVTRRKDAPRAWTKKGAEEAEGKELWESLPAILQETARQVVKRKTPISYLGVFSVTLALLRFGGRNPAVVSYALDLMKLCLGLGTKI